MCLGLLCDSADSFLSSRVGKSSREEGPMVKKRCAIYILFLLAGLSVVAAYVGFTHWPFQAQERPTLVYFYAGG